MFFVRLDEELNKVNQFYMRQESEFLERGDTLNKQLQLLLDLKQIISDRRRKSSPPSKANNNTGVFPHSPARDSDYSGQRSPSIFLISIQTVPKQSGNCASLCTRLYISCIFNAVYIIICIKIITIYILNFFGN